MEECVNLEDVNLKQQGGQDEHLESDDDFVESDDDYVDVQSLHPFRDPHLAEQSEEFCVARRDALWRTDNTRAAENGSGRNVHHPLETSFATTRSNLRRGLPLRRAAKYTINGDNSAKFKTEGTGEACARGVAPIYRAHQTTDDMPAYESPTDLRLLTFNLSDRTRRSSSIQIGPTAGPNCFSKIDASSFRQAERRPGKTSGQDKWTGEGCAAASLQSNYNVCRVSFEQPPNESTGKASEASKASPLACCSHDRHGFVSLFCVMVVCVSLSLCATALAGFAIYRASPSGTGLSLQHGTSWSIAQEGNIGKDTQTKKHTDTKGGLQSLN